MCRHLAYAGPPASLRSLLIDPPHSLYRQAWAPRLQRHGTVNADGFGVGWYADGDPVPARYRRGVPMWGDPSLPDITRVTRSGAVLAAVRSATAGTAVGEQAAAPFGHGRWLFSHNGLLDGWPGSAAAIADRASEAGGCDNGPPTAGSLPRPPSAAALLSLEALVDSAFLWALVLERLQAGSAMGAALAGTIAAVEAAGGSGRFNFLLIDGYTIAATACGDTLWYRQANEVMAERAPGTTATADPGAPTRMTGPPAGAMTDLAPADGLAPATSVVVASEPSNDEPGWIEVPDRHLLTATPRGVSLQPLAADIRGAPADDAAADGFPAGNPGRPMPPTDSDVSTEGILT
jgi:gamma-glutamyl hercynylcysteine S-oxide hydrolase